MPWNELIGHEQTAARLAAAVARGRLAGAYLFAGPSGVGKTLAARLFAQAILCQNAARRGAEAAAGDPCGACASCRRVVRGSHADLLRPEVDDEAIEITIDAIRRIDATVHLKPIAGDRQVVILPDADRMNPNAENALLKTLEEPPAHAVLVLTSSRPEELLPTTRSRCLRVRFAPLSLEDLERFLVERKGVDPDEAIELVRYGAGSPGRALSATGPVVRALREFAEDHIAGLPSAPRDAPALIAREAETLVEAHAQALEGRRSLTPAAGRRVEALRLLAVLELFFREAMLFSLASGAGMLEKGPSQTQAPGWAVGPAGFEAAFGHLAEAERAVRQNVRVGSALHVLFIRLRQALR